MNPAERSRARAAVQYAVKHGRMPRADALPCSDCSGTAKEYDHYLGYESDHRLHVQAVCKRCHAKRTAAELEDGRRVGDEPSVMVGPVYTPLDGYLTATQARERLGVAKSTFQAMVRRGAVTVHRDPKDTRARLFRVRDIERLGKVRPERDSDDGG